ncbi:hypothetical protein B2G52_08830 [Neisseria lactamica]|uniref:Uncharacterized protein n=1 Tax=Neisseria lactamica TaxID=486 RepID=A0AAU8VI38_NEILA|nr:hypothetical protein B2G52_08830 [Neisseria lactamica]
MPLKAGWTFAECLSGRKNYFIVKIFCLILIVFFRNSVKSDNPFPAGKVAADEKSMHRLCG